MPKSRRTRIEYVMSMIPNKSDELAFPFTFNRLILNPGKTYNVNASRRAYSYVVIEIFPRGKPPAAFCNLTLKGRMCV